jgi:hypothetical protein
MSAGTPLSAAAVGRAARRALAPGSAAPPGRPYQTG